MNYKLALALKDAGFPQKDGFQFIDSKTIWDATAQSELETPRTPPRSMWVKCPSLEELIEACGTKWFTLEERSGDKPSEKDGTWYAQTRGVKGARGEGSTPTEAVAYLYLSLIPLLNNEY